MNCDGEGGGGDDDVDRDGTIEMVVVMANAMVTVMNAL